MVERRGRVEGKVALVTGAASGLGAETARRLAREGASVLLTDVAVEAGFIRSPKRSPSPAWQGGVRRPRGDFPEADWDRAVAAAVERFGRLDVLVNNAGIGEGGLGDLMTSTPSKTGVGCCPSTSMASSWACVTPGRPWPRPAAGR